MLRRLTTILIFLGLMAGAWIAPAVAQEEDPDVSGLIDVINDVRSERNMQPLRFEPRLTQIAEDLALAVWRGESLDGLADGLEYLLRQRGYPHMLYGGRYATTSASVDTMVRNWLLESGPGSILVNGQASEIGVAFLNGDDSPVPDMPPNIWAVVIADPARPAESDWERRVVQHVNRFRRENGLPPLEVNAFLSRAAMAHARDMLARDFFSHYNPDGLGPGDRATAAGYQWSRILENLASGQESARSAVTAWIRSTDGHREAMLDPSVSEVGVGYIFTPFDPGRIGSLHYWAMTLGRPIEP